MLMNSLWNGARYVCREQQWPTTLCIIRQRHFTHCLPVLQLQHPLVGLARGSGVRRLLAGRIASHASSADSALAAAIGSTVGLLAAGFGPAGVSQFTAAAAALGATPLSAGGVDADVAVQQLCRVDDVMGEIVDALGDALMEQGALSITVEEFRPHGKDEQQIYGDGRSNRVWDRCSLSAMFPAEADVSMAVQCAAELAGLSQLPQYHVEQVADREWVESIKASYQPLEVAAGLWIVPTWCQPQDPTAVNIIMEPGLAFGTGEHPTTRLCLRWINTQQLEGKTLVDYGTGSGILAIAALLRGASFAAATDTDPLAVSAARQNAALNGVTSRLAVAACEPAGDAPEPLAAAGVRVPEGGLFDVCVANILQGPLLELCDRLSRYVTPGGSIALSGILETQAPAVQAEYSRFFTDLEVTTEGPWALLTGTRLGNRDV